jgi:hypothetical protein
MKYLTADWLGEYKVKIMLTFTRTAKEWGDYDAELSESMKEERIKQQNTSEYQEYVDNKISLLKKYLPPHLASSYVEIEDIVLRRGYPNPELKKQIDDWVADAMTEYERLLDQSCDHYETIKDQLPSAVVNDLFEHTMHDCKVLSVETPSSDTFIMTLRNGGFWNHEFIKLTFTGVEELLMPEQLLHNFWMHDEVYPTPTGFELHVLFSYPNSEFKVVAKDVAVEEFGQNLQASIKEFPEDA